MGILFFWLTGIIFAGFHWHKTPPFAVAVQGRNCDLAAVGDLSTERKLMGLRLRGS